jgi:hypothetical protein
VTRKLVGYGIVGLVIAVALVAGLQVRPQSLLPSMGTIQVSIINDPLTVKCSHGQGQGRVNVTLTSLVVNISSVEVHRTGALGLNGEWIKNITTFPKTLDVLQLNGVSQLLGSTSLPEGTIDIVRITIASATAGTNTGPAKLIVSSDSLQAQPGAQVTGGLKTSIVVEPHVICEGNATFRLTPELTSTSQTTD